MKTEKRKFENGRTNQNKKIKKMAKPVLIKLQTTKFWTKEEARICFEKSHVEKTKNLTNLERFGASTGYQETVFIPPEEAEQHLADFIVKLGNSNRFNSEQVEIVVLCSAAVRACDVIRNLNSNKKLNSLKLFAKHLKLEQQVEMIKDLSLKSSKTDKIVVAVATPNRFAKLLENGCVSANVLKYVVLDMKPDQKMYTLLTLPLVSDDLFSTFRKYLNPSILTNETKIVLW